jgi:hypothetical protein
MRDEENMSERVNLAMPLDLRRSIDDWRRGQPDLPNRADAARRLIIRGLAADEVMTASTTGAVKAAPKAKAAKRKSAA